MGSEITIDNVAISNTLTAVNVSRVVLTPDKTSMDATALHKYVPTPVLGGV
jgi:hypothetical protein